MNNIRIDSDRLWRSLMAMAALGATGKGGVRRLALTDIDRAARDLFVRWCREAGCTVSVDAMGNIFARRPGRDGSRPPVLVGSHLDSQPNKPFRRGSGGVISTCSDVSARRGGAPSRMSQPRSWARCSIARSATAVIVNSGWTPSEQGMTEPSHT